MLTSPEQPVKAHVQKPLDIGAIYGYNILINNFFLLVQVPEMKYSKWIIPRGAPDISPALADAGYTPLLAAMLAQRGFTEPEAADEFINGGIELLLPPESMADMSRAAERVRAAIERGETVAVYGDYDVDGITSACLVASYLRQRGLKCRPYIPDRLEEGYGLNTAALDTIKASGATLVITVDCGITAVQEAEHAKALGLDLIITDHHECGSLSLPDALAVVDPKRHDCPYPNKGLAGVGVAFKLLCAVDGDADALLERYADLVAAGTVADVMPLTGENRYIVRRGLEQMASRPRPGVEALLSECGGGAKRLTATTVGFTIAPRINAAGRLGNAVLAARLLMSSTLEEASPLARELCRMNRERQELEHGIWTEAHELLKKNPPDGPIVLYSEGWHQGVIGIAASRLSEEFHLPCIMICVDGEMGKGSCRSYGGFNLFDALSACSDCLEGFGGHALAAGLTIRRDRIDAFRAKLADYYRQCPCPELPVLDCELHIEDPALLSMDCVQSLELLEPYGAGNPQPVLCLTDSLLDRVTPIGGGNHLKLRLVKGGVQFECVMFGMRAENLGASEGSQVDAAFYPQINEFHGRRSVQLLMVDLRPADTRGECEGILSGKLPCAWECADIYPERRDFVRVWRWLERAGGHVECDLASGWGPDGLSAAKTAVCLRAMAEEYLAGLESSGGRLSISALKREGKANLEASPVMKELRRRRDEYRERRRKHD